VAVFLLVKFGGDHGGQARGVGVCAFNHLPGVMPGRFRLCVFVQGYCCVVCAMCPGLVVALGVRG